MVAVQLLLVALQAWAIAAAPVSNVLVARQKDTITAALSMVEGSLQKLDTAVKSVSATDANSLTGVLNAAQGAQSTLTKATSMIESADNIGLFGALGLQQSATGLVDTVTTTLDDLKGKKPVFDQLGVTSVVAENLEQQKAGSGQLGDTLLSKVPALARPIAQQSTGQLTEALDSAIATFKQPAAKPAAPAAPKPPGTPAAPAKPATPAKPPAAPAVPAAA